MAPELKSILGMICTIAFCQSFAGPTISNVQACQKTGYAVDVSYTLSSDDSTELYRVKLQVESDGVFLPVDTLEGDVGENISAGLHHITWKAKDDWPNNLSSNCIATVSVFGENGVVSIAILMDSTGSMSGAMSAFKSAATEMAMQILSANSNSRIAVVDYRDFPEWTGWYGDYPYNVCCSFSDNPMVVASAIENISPDGGGDYEESVYTALAYTAMGVGLGSWGGSSRAILLFADAPAHDPEPYTGYTSDTISNLMKAYGIKVYDYSNFASGIAASTGGLSNANVETILQSIKHDAVESQESSLRFVVDTRDIKIQNVLCPYCNGEYGNGRKGTFLTGVECKVDFEVEIEVPEGSSIDYLLVNGERINSIDSFEFNVGRLNPGDGLDVVAVDTDGNESEPFRVNLDIADCPPLWVKGFTRILAEKQPKYRRILYTTSEVNTLALFDAFEDGLDLAGAKFPFAFMPSIQVYQTFESDSAQFHASSSVGGATKNQKVGKISGLDVTVALSGGRVYQWAPRSLSWIIDGNELCASVGGQFETPKFRLPQFPLAYAKASFGASGDISLQEHDGQWYFDFYSDSIVFIRGTVGAGVDGLLCGEGYIQGGLPIHVISPGNPNHIQQLGLQAQAAIVGVVGGFKHTVWKWQGTHWFIGGNRMRLMGAGDSPSLDIDDAGWTLLSRDYACAGGGGRRRLLASSGSSGSGSLGDGYPYPSPSLTARGTEDILLYLRDNNARTAVNRTELVYRSGVGDEWSSAEVVLQDGTADFMPNVAANDNGTVVAAWVNVNKELADDATLSDMCRSMEIAVGIIDAATGAWDCGNLTCDAALDVAPKVKVAADGSAVVAWVRNDMVNSLVLRQSQVRS